MNEAMAYIVIAFCSICLGYGAYKVCLKKYDTAIPNAVKDKPKKATTKDGPLSTVKQIASKLDKVLPIAKSDSDEYRMQLARAGVQMDPKTYHGITLMVLAGSTLLGILISLLEESLLVKALIIVVATALGFIVPRLLLAQMAKARREVMLSDLPNGLEMLAAVVSTGQPIESGFRIVSNASTGALSAEFRQVDTEINLTGKSRSDAMRSLAERCQLPSISIFCSAIIQATEQGAPIARTLRGQANIARKEARARLEEKANKIPVKQKIPLVIFFVGAMLLLVLAPKAAMVIDMLNSVLS